MAVNPVAKRVYVCDDVSFDPATRKPSLLNLWDTVRVPSVAAFPYVLERVCVFVWWRDGFGKVGSYVDLVQGTSGKVLRRTKTCILNFQSRTSSIYARYMIKNCTFPAPGYYHIEVYCENQFVDDQIIRIITA